MEKPILPTVSVIMPIRNEAHYIARSLGAVLDQDYPSDRLEVLIVDGASNDGTRATIRELLHRRKLEPAEFTRVSADGYSEDRVLKQADVRTLDNPAQFVSFALNIGLLEARGSVIILVGGHCEIASDYVRRCVKALKQTGADCVGGLLTTVGETLPAQAIALAQSSPFGVGGVAFRTGRSGPGYVDTVVFGAYRREVFDRIGGFDEELVRNQDDEFNYRLAHAKGRIWLDPSIRCVYYSRAALRRLWRQYFQYGYWKVRVFQKHPRQMRLRHFVPAIFITTVLMGMLFAPFSVPCYYLCFFILGLYALSNAAASLSAARKSGWRYLPFLPVAFTTLHMSYGFGFLVGLVKFRNRWGNTRNRVSVSRGTPAEIDARPEG